MTQSTGEVGGAPRGPYSEEFLTGAEAVNKEAAALGAWFPMRQKTEEGK